MAGFFYVQTMNRHGHPIAALDATIPDDVRLLSEIVLWNTVIALASKDAQRKAKGHQALKAKREASLWLLNNREDFTFVCDLAGRDPETVRREAKKKLH
jgi:hypothetical protein